MSKALRIKDNIGITPLDQRVPYKFIMSAKSVLKLPLLLKRVYVIGVLIILSHFVYRLYADFSISAVSLLKPSLVAFFQLTVLYFLVNEIRLFFSNFRRNLKLSFSFWSRYTWKIFLHCLIIALVTLLLSLALTSVPFLSKGWTHFFFDSGGNILFSIMDLQDPIISIVLVSLVLIAFFIVFLPHLALLEETAFRKNRFSLFHRIRASIVFGMVHLIMGIPIGAGLALCFTGFAYSHIYISSYRNIIAKSHGRNGVRVDRSVDKYAAHKAMHASTTYHSLVNTIFFGILFLLLFSLFALLLCDRFLLSAFQS